MNIHGKDIKIFTANANPKVAKEIAQVLGLPLGKSTVTSFADGEISVSIEETVRGSDVFVVQSTCGPVNNNLMELLIMIDAFKRASAGRITAVIPYYGYARQDRKAKANWNFIRSPFDNIPGQSDFFSLNTESHFRKVSSPKAG